MAYDLLSQAHAYSCIGIIPIYKHGCVRIITWGCHYHYGVSLLLAYVYARIRILTGDRDTYYINGS